MCALEKVATLLAREHSRSPLRTEGQTSPLFYNKTIFINVLLLYYYFILLVNNVNCAVQESSEALPLIPKHFD